MEFGGQIKEGGEDGLIAFKDCIMADGGSDVGFADPCGANEDEVAGFFQPVGVKKLHDLIAGILGLKVQSKSPRSLTLLIPSRNPEGTLMNSITSLLIP
jgi:hypothetical protein